MNIMYCISFEMIRLMTMGPICITPELKRQGYGKSGFTMMWKSEEN
ncbi:hypothetical protein LIP55_01210 [[Ruminococcus] gnavus]|nr:hypothetical protein [Mediterraneibacter gnavus]